MIDSFGFGSTFFGTPSALTALDVVLKATALMATILSPASLPARTASSWIRTAPSTSATARTIGCGCGGVDLVPSP